MIFVALNNSNCYATYWVILIWYQDHVINFTKHLDKVCRTNLFHFWFTALKEFHVFRDLNNSKLDENFYESLIYHKESLVNCLAQLEKVYRTKLFSFGLFQFENRIIKYGFKFTSRFHLVEMSCMNAMVQQLNYHYCYSLSLLQKWGCDDPQV